MKFKYKYTIIFAIILFSISAYFWYINSKLSEEILENGKYTICKVTKIEGAIRSGPNLEYSFMVKGEYYTGSTKIVSFDKSLIGRKFFIQFLKEKPDVSIIFLEREAFVPDSVMIPPEGWDTLPTRYLVKPFEE